MCRIPPREYEERVESLCRAVRGAGIDLFLVSSFESIYYLTGACFEPLERPFFLLVRADRDRRPELLVPKLDEDHMRRNARGILPECFHTYWERPAPPGRDWLSRLRELLGGGRLGVEPTMPLEFADSLRDYRPQVAPLVEQLRIVKSPAEVAMVRRAARYADFAVRRLLGASYFGASVAEGFAQTRAVTGRILREVSDCELLTTRVIMATWPAPGSARPHSIPRLIDRLEGGPQVALALTRVNGYSAESERTYFTATPTPEARRAFGAMMEARRLALELVRPGAACAEIDAAVGEFLQREYPDYEGEDRRLHRTGHGVGLGTHEGPWLAAGSTDVLAPNMVISIEPGIYLPELGGFRHSDTVLVTGDGCELLTRLPADIDALTIRGWRPLARARGWVIRRALGVGRRQGTARVCTSAGSCSVRSRHC